MSKSYKILDEEYKDKYGSIPCEREQILEFLQTNLKLDYDKIKDEEEKINNIPWKEVELTLNVVPKPSPRPRYSFKTNHFYVMGAGENKKLIKEYIEESDIIFTRTEFTIETYQPTPRSVMKNDEIYLAEMGMIRPIQDPDWDNLGKTYSDMIQGILLLNDNIISRGLVEKYFSVKPRVVIKIRYQSGFDSKFNEKKILNSRSYKKTFGDDT